MQNLLSLFLVAFAQLYAAFLYTNKNGLTIHYSITYKNRCHSDEGKFSMKRGLSVPQCVEECGLRRHCAALTYKRRYGLCELFLFAEELDVTQGDCIIINVSDIAVTEMPCDDCMFSQTCDPYLKACIQKECLNTTVLTKGKIFGNHNNNGAMIKYECIRGYREINDGKGVCLETGQWNAPIKCVMDCGNPPPINNGHVLSLGPDSAFLTCGFGYQSEMSTIICTESGSWDTVTCDRIDCGDPPASAHGTAFPVIGTYYLDTAYVTCDEGYQTETTTIKCTVTGEWETANCIDCYIGSRQEYMGRINVTKSGRLCQRWDSQSPHPHIHTDLQHFPDPTLAAASNYCRAPSGDYDPWCMTMDPNKEWEYCDVEQCPWT